jgi:hypothetical protein
LYIKNNWRHVQCCSARPKSILQDPKTEQEGKVLMLDKLLLNTMIKRSLLPGLCFHRGGQLSGTFYDRVVSDLLSMKSLKSLSNTLLG